MRSPRQIPAERWQILSPTGARNSLRGMDTMEKGELFRLVQSARAAIGDAVTVLPFDDGSRFLGGAAGGEEPSGRGVFLFKAGDPEGRAEYRGEFAGGKGDGAGRMSFSDGSVYEGEWRGGQMEGHGVVQWPDSSEWAGEFRGNSKHGLGMFTFADGQRHGGGFRAGRFTKGSLADVQQTLREARAAAGRGRERGLALGPLAALAARVPEDFEGEATPDAIEQHVPGPGLMERAGSLTTVFPAATEVAAEPRALGTGVAMEAGGARGGGGGGARRESDGELSRLAPSVEKEVPQRPSGKGKRSSDSEIDRLVRTARAAIGDNVAVLPFDDGGRFVGTVEEGGEVPSGWGVFVFAPDDPEGRTEYRGEFVGGKGEGKGRMLFKDNSSYEGDWRGGQMEGHGVVQWPDSSEWAGEFKSNSKHGLGMHLFPDGRTHQGEFESDISHGKILEKYPRGDAQEVWAEHEHGKNIKTKSANVFNWYSMPCPLSLPGIPSCTMMLNGA